MALMEFEKLVADDHAADGLFLEFVQTVNDGGGGNAVHEPKAAIIVEDVHLNEVITDDCNTAALIETSAQANSSFFVGATHAATLTSPCPTTANSAPTLDTNTVPGVGSPAGQSMILANAVSGPVSSIQSVSRAIDISDSSRLENDIASASAKAPQLALLDDPHTALKGSQFVHNSELERSAARFQASKATNVSMGSVTGAMEASSLSVDNRGPLIAYSTSHASTAADSHDTAGYHQADNILVVKRHEPQVLFVDQRHSSLHETPDPRQLISGSKVGEELQHADHMAREEEEDGANFF